MTARYMLTLRQTVQLSKRDSTCPAGNYTAPDGLEFETYCGYDVPNGDLSTSGTQATDVIDCMNSCSTHRPLCYAVAFDISTGTCYQKNNTVTKANLTQAANLNSAIAQASQFSPLSTSCPYANNSIQTSADGAQYQIVCGLDLNGDDYCPQGAPSCPFHADSLEDCMNWCSSSHPLCAGVAYNPDLIAGYANCYPKNNATVQLVAQSDHVTHTALLQINPPNAPCSGTSYTSGNGKIFKLSCNVGRESSDIISYHEDDLNTCLDRCANYTSQACLGVVFDPSLQNGYENCYLKNSTGLPIYNSASSSALLNSYPGNSTSPSSSSSSGGSRSKAWIAGPVIGGLAAVALLIALAWWLRRRSAGRRVKGTPGNSDFGPTRGYDLTKPEQVAEIAHSSEPYHARHELETNTPRTELAS